MQTRRSIEFRRALRRLLAGALVPWAVAAHAAPLSLPSFGLTPWGAWTAFALAITLVIVLLLWHAVDEGPADAHPAPRTNAMEPPDGRPRADAERHDERRAA